jgi:hypothetical protein
MKNPNDIEIEIDEIRDKIYKTTQKMSSQERVEYINSHAHEVLKNQQQLNCDAVRLNQSG